MTALVVVIVLGVASTALLLAALVALTRHLKLLAKSVAAFRDATRPDLDEIRRGMEETRTHLDELPERIPKRTPSGRIRR